MRSLRHVWPTIAAAVLAASVLVAPTVNQDSPASASNAAAISASAPAQAAACHRGTNAAHAQAGRATRWLIFVWAKGSNNYLGTILATTSLREGPSGTWTMVPNCEGEPPPPPQSGWPTVGLNLQNTRAATNETGIGTNNIGELGRIWELPNVEGVTGTPIVIDGVVYVGDWTGHVRALDAATGQQRWAQDVGSQIPGAVAVDSARVYAGTWDGRLVARDRQTGAAVWEKEVDTHEVAVVYGSPVVHDGKVIVPVSSDEWWDGGEFTFRGSVVAFDAATGNEVWRYWTTCGPENAGRNNCPADTPNEGYGVATWAYPVIDTQRNLVFFGTGNQYAQPTSGRSDALIALDLATGQERWVHQITPNDWWNLPAQGSDPNVGPDADVMTATLMKVGNTDAVGVGDKAGNYVAMNRETGQELWKVDLSDGSIQGGIMAPATLVEGNPSTPDDDVLYVTTNRGGQDADIVALDTADGRVINRADVQGQVVSPPTWANGLIYLADNKGRISAFDAGNLQRVWDWNTEAPAAGGISIAQGRVYAGWGWALNGESARGGLLAFAIGGEPQEEPPPPPDGAAVYAANCAGCHGADGSGGAGPSLQGIGQAHSLEEITQVIRDGRGAMPAWGNQLTPEELAAVATYVSQIPGDHQHDHDAHAAAP